MHEYHLYFLSKIKIILDYKYQTLYTLHEQEFCFCDLDPDIELYLYIVLILLRTQIQITEY